MAALNGHWSSRSEKQGCKCLAGITHFSTTLQERWCKEQIWKAEGLKGTGQSPAHADPCGWSTSAITHCYLLHGCGSGTAELSLCRLSLLHKPDGKHRWNRCCHLLGIEIFTDKTTEWPDAIRQTALQASLILLHPDILWRAHWQRWNSESKSICLEISMGHLPPAKY